MPAKTHLTVKELKALEKVFAAEIENRLPFQSRAKIFADLCADGYLAKIETTYGSGWLAVKVAGYTLTHAGRIEYCLSCDDSEAA